MQEPVQGQAVLSGGVVTFTPSENYAGPASFAYTISDGKGGKATAKVLISVNSVETKATETITPPPPPPLVARFRVSGDFWYAYKLWGTEPIDYLPRTTFSGKTWFQLAAVDRQELRMEGGSPYSIEINDLVKPGRDYVLEVSSERSGIVTRRFSVPSGQTDFWMGPEIVFGFRFQRVWVRIEPDWDRVFAMEFNGVEIIPDEPKDGDASTKDYELRLNKQALVHYRFELTGHYPAEFNVQFGEGINRMPGITFQPRKTPILTEAWTNTLDMAFLPGDDCLIAETEVTRSQYRRFVNETGWKNGKEMWIINRGGQILSTSHTWEDPGFRQGTNHPVVGVSSEDAEAFCEWLTETERKAREMDPGEIGIETNQTYRLPTSNQWNRMASGLVYPWGNTIPPQIGNYARNGDGNDVEWWGKERISERDAVGLGDIYPRTAPVSASNSAAVLARNPNGFFGIGNVKEWCRDIYLTNLKPEGFLVLYPAIDLERSLGADAAGFIQNPRAEGGGKAFRVVRDNSWADAPKELNKQHYLLSQGGAADPSQRSDTCGFRVILERE